MDLSSEMPEPMLRSVIVHFHLFKNAGTSVERGLASFFGDDWVSFDKPSSGGRIDQHELVEFLSERPHIKAVSSHQLRVPLDPSDGFHFLPLVFLRHPLDRIRSAYDFERKQGGVSPSSRAAEKMSMAEWIDFHRGRGSTQISNFQTLAFSEFRASNGAPLMKMPIEHHLASAQKFLDGLPVVGLVESYSASWRRLSQWIQQHHQGFEAPAVHSNATSDKTTSASDRAGALRQLLGDDQFARLEDENAVDITLHEWAAQRFASQDAST